MKCKHGLTREWCYTCRTGTKIEPECSGANNISAYIEHGMVMHCPIVDVDDADEWSPGYRKTGSVCGVPACQQLDTLNEVISVDKTVNIPYRRMAFEFCMGKAISTMMLKYYYDKYRYMVERRVI